MVIFLSYLPAICHCSNTIPELSSMVKGNETVVTGPPCKSPRLAEIAEAARSKVEAGATKLKSSSSAVPAQTIKPTKKPGIKWVKPTVVTQMTKSDYTPASTPDSRSKYCDRSCFGPAQYNNFLTAVTNYSTTTYFD